MCLFIYMNQYKLYTIDFTDVDECHTDNGGCNQTCTNTHGSYICSCIGLYTLDDDQHGCIGIVHA